MRSDGKKCPIIPIIQDKRVSVVQYDTDGNFIQRYNSINEASIITNLDGSSISKCINGKLNKTGGFIWKKDGDDI